jgi:hypothetical protein
LIPGRTAPERPREESMTRAARLTVLAALALAPAGCSTTPPPKTEDPDTTNLRRIYQAFRLCADFKNRGPRDEAELKQYLGELGEPGTPEEFLISRRDNQPFVIFYGHAIDWQAGDVILAHEKNGANGGRFALTLAGRIKAFTDEEFAKAQFAGKKPPKASG